MAEVSSSSLPPVVRPPRESRSQNHHHNRRVTIIRPDGINPEAFEHRHYLPLHPTCNLLIAKRWEDYVRDIHLKRLKQAKPTIDDSKPRVYRHLDMRLKKQQMEEERVHEIEKNNNILFHRILNQKISHSEISDISKIKEYIENRNHIAESHQHFRNRNNERILKENLTILQRIEEKAPNYNRLDWHSSRFRNLGYLCNIAQYPKHYWDLLVEGKDNYDLVRPRTHHSPRVEAIARRASQVKTAPERLGRDLRPKTRGAPISSPLPEADNDEERPLKTPSKPSSLNSVKKSQTLVKTSTSDVKAGSNGNVPQSVKASTPKIPTSKKSSVNNLSKSHSNISSNRGSKSKLLLDELNNSGSSQNTISDNRSIKLKEDEESAKAAIIVSDDLADLGIVDYNSNNAEEDKNSGESRPSSGWSEFADASPDEASASALLDDPTSNENEGAALNWEEEEDNNAVDPNYQQDAVETEKRIFENSYVEQDAVVNSGEPAAEGLERSSLANVDMQEDSLGYDKYEFVESSAQVEYNNFEPTAESSPRAAEITEEVAKSRNEEVYSQVDNSESTAQVEFDNFEAAEITAQVEYDSFKPAESGAQVEEIYNAQTDSDNSDPVEGAPQVEVNNFEPVEGSTEVEADNNNNFEHMEKTVQASEENAASTGGDFHEADQKTVITSIEKEMSPLHAESGVVDVPEQSQPSEPDSTLDTPGEEVFKNLEVEEKYESNQQEVENQFITPDEAVLDYSESAEMQEHRQLVDGVENQINTPKEVDVAFDASEASNKDETEEQGNNADMEHQSTTADLDTSTENQKDFVDALDSQLAESHPLKDEIAQQNPATELMYESYHDEPSAYPEEFDKTAPEVMSSEQEVEQESPKSGNDAADADDTFEDSLGAQKQGDDSSMDDVPLGYLYSSIPTALDKEESGLENHESDSSFKKSIPLPPIESLSKRPSSSSISRNGSTPLSRPMSATVLGPIANSKPPSRPMSGYISEHASSHSRRTSLPALVKTLSSPSSRPLSGIRPILSKPESKDELKNRDSEMQLTESAQDHGDFAEEGPRAEAGDYINSHKESIDEAFEKTDNLLVAAQEQRPAGDQSQLEILENDNQTQDFGVADEKENNVGTVMAKDVEHKDLLETIPSNEVHQPGGPIDLDEYEAKLETDADATAEQPTIGSNNTPDERNERQTTQKNSAEIMDKILSVSSRVELSLREAAEEPESSLSNRTQETMSDAILETSSYAMKDNVGITAEQSASQPHPSKSKRNSVERLKSLEADGMSASLASLDDATTNGTTIKRSHSKQTSARQGEGLSSSIEASPNSTKRKSGRVSLNGSQAKLVKGRSGVSLADLAPLPK